MTHKNNIPGFQEKRLLYRRWRNINRRRNRNESYEHMEPNQNREDFEKKRAELGKRKDSLIDRIQEIQDRVKNKREWESYKQHFVRDFEYWNTRYDSIGAGHRRSFQSNLENVLKRYEYQVSGRDQDTTRASAEIGTSSARASVLERVQGNTWAVVVPDGARLAIKFDRYQNWQYIQSNTVSMGDMRTNGFHVSRDRRNRNRILIQSNYPFSYAINGVIQGSTESTPGTREDIEEERKPERDLDRESNTSKVEQAKRSTGTWGRIEGGVAGYEYCYVEGKGLYAFHAGTQNLQRYDQQPNTWTKIEWREGTGIPRPRTMRETQAEITRRIAAKQEAARIEEERIAAEKEAVRIEEERIAAKQKAARIEEEESDDKGEENEKVSNTLKRIPLTQEAQTYAEKGGKLLKQTSSLSPQLSSRNKFNEYIHAFFLEQIDKQKSSPEIRLITTGNTKYPYGLLINGKDTWYIEAYGIKKSGSMVATFHATNANGEIDRMTNTSLKIRTKNDLDLGALLKLTQVTRENRKSEESDSAGARSFDLPKGKPIGYISITDTDHGDKNPNKVSYKQGHLLPELMSAAGYDMVQPKERVTEVTGDPKEILEQKIEELYASGVRNFYLNLFGHGNYLGIHFPGNGKRGILNFNDLKSIFYKYPKCTFILNTIACYGGGLAKHMENFEDSPLADEGRIALFLHTKRHALNYAFYNRILAAYLNMMAEGTEGAPKTYGEAHYMTDLYLKRGKQLDAEFWKSRPGQKSIRTAKTESGEAEPLV